MRPGFRRFRDRLATRVKHDSDKIIDGPSDAGDHAEPEPDIGAERARGPDTERDEKSRMHDPVDEGVELVAEFGTLALDAGDFAVAVVQHIRDEQEHRSRYYCVELPLH